MHKSVVTAVAAFVLGSLTTGVLVAQAQTAAQSGDAMPPAAAGARGPGMGPNGMIQGGMGGDQGSFGQRMREHRAHRMEMMRAFALVNHVEDRKLTPPDVQKIAEAFLLWKGNHSWKVLNVKPAGDLIGFDLATEQGSVIAHFTMDPKTGRLARLG